MISPRPASLGACNKAGQKTHSCKLRGPREEGCFLAPLPLSSCCSQRSRSSTPTPLCRPAASETALLASRQHIRIKLIAQQQLCCQAELCSAGNSSSAPQELELEKLCAASLAPQRRGPVFTPILDMLQGVAWLVAPNPSSLLSPQVHFFILSEDIFPHYAPAYPKHYILQDPECPPACVSRSRMDASQMQSLHRDRAATGNGCSQAALATTILWGYSHARLLTEVGSDKARLFLGQKATTGTPLAQGNSASRTDAGFCFVSWDRGG